MSVDSATRLATNKYYLKRILTLSVSSLRLSCLSCPQVREVVQPLKPALSTVVARPVRKAPPTSIQDMRRYPEIIPVQEVILEESAEEESSAPPSEERGWCHSVLHSVYSFDKTLSKYMYNNSLHCLDLLPWYL